MMSFWVVPLSLARVDAVLLGDRDVEAEQPGGGRVDRHRGVHLVERDPVEELVHVALVGDRDADLADLAAGEDVVGVIAGLGRQVEGDREAGLALGEVAAVELVRAARVGVPGVGAHHPGAVALGKSVLAHVINDICSRGKDRRSSAHGRIFPAERCLGLADEGMRITGAALAVAHRGAGARPRGRRRGGTDRPLPQPDGDHEPARRPVKLSGARCQRGGSEHALRIASASRPRNAPTARR